MVIAVIARGLGRTLDISPVNYPGIQIHLSTWFDTGYPKPPRKRWEYTGLAVTYLWSIRSYDPLRGNYSNRLAAKNLCNNSTHSGARTPSTTSIR
jgi:hypothetical protein